MNVKRLLAILAAMAVMIAIFAACGRDNGGDVATPATPTPPAADPAPPADDNDDNGDDEEAPVVSRWADSEHIEFIFFTDHDPTPSDPYRHVNVWRQHLYNYFNVSIRYIQIPDPQENLALMLATGTFPCLVFPRNTGMLRNYLDAGVLHELSELFLAYAPNVVERNSRFWPQLRAFSNTEGLYVYNVGQPGNTSGFTVPWLEWIIRMDILVQQDWPNIVDENDLFDVLQQGLIDNPYTVQGLPVTAFAQPLAAWGYNGLRCIAFMWHTGPNNHMFFNDNGGMLYDVRQGVFIDATAELSYRNGLEFINRLWRYDMYHRDAPTNGWDEFYEKMQHGRVLSSFFYIWPKLGWNNHLRMNDLPYRYVPVPLMLSSQIAAGDQKRGFVSAPEIWSAGGITTNVQDLERTIAILDWQASYEGKILAGWGLEGEHWYMGDDGWRVPSARWWELFEMPDTEERRLGLAETGASNLFGLYGDLLPNGQNVIRGSCARVSVQQLDPQVRYFLERHGWASYRDMYAHNPNFVYGEPTSIAFKQTMPSWDDNTQRNARRIYYETHGFTMRLITAETEEAFDRIFAEMQEWRFSMGLQEKLDFWNAEYLEIRERFGG